MCEQKHSKCAEVDFRLSPWQKQKAAEREAQRAAEKAQRDAERDTARQEREVWQLYISVLHPFAYIPGWPAGMSDIGLQAQGAPNSRRLASQLGHSMNCRQSGQRKRSRSRRRRRASMLAP